MEVEEPRRKEDLREGPILPPRFFGVLFKGTRVVTGKDSGKGGNNGWEDRLNCSELRKYTAGSFNFTFVLPTCVCVKCVHVTSHVYLATNTHIPFLSRICVFPCLFMYIYIHTCVSIYIHA